MSTTEAGPKTGESESRGAGRIPAPLGRARFRREMPLVPASSISGRALAAIIAIMTFLAGLTTGGVVLVVDASSAWRGSVSQEITIQVKPSARGNADEQARKAADLLKAWPGVREVEAVSREAAARMLEPWLGSGLDFSELPVPRLVVAKLEPGSAPDLAALRARLAEVAPLASLDNHGVWIERLATISRVFIAAALGILGLVVIAMALAVAFATRGAMAGNRETVDVLHLVGAEDRYIAREFERHFLQLGLKGAATGGLAALAIFAGAGIAARWSSATPAGEQIEIMFGAFSLGFTGYLSIAAVALFIGVLTGAMSRTIVYRRLRGLD